MDRNGDHWNGNAVLGFKGLSEETKEQRCNLVGRLMIEYGEKPFRALSRQKLKDYLTAPALGLPSNAGNLMSALKGMTSWMKGSRPGVSVRGPRSDCWSEDRQGEGEQGERRLQAVDGVTDRAHDKCDRFALGTEAYR